MSPYRPESVRRSLFRDAAARASSVRFPVVDPCETAVVELGEPFTEVVLIGPLWNDPGGVQIDPDSGATWPPSRWPYPAGPILVHRVSQWQTVPALKKWFLGLDRRPAREACSGR